MSTTITRYKTNNQIECIQRIEPDVVINEYLVTTVYKSATIPVNVIEKGKRPRIWGYDESLNKCYLLSLYYDV